MIDVNLYLQIIPRVSGVNTEYRRTEKMPLL